MSDDGPESLYTALIGHPEYLRGVRRMQYRCARERCLLLDAIETPGGVLLHQKRHKFSPEVNDDVSNAAGRAAQTFDGQNHWKPRTYALAESALAHRDDDRATLGLVCDHTPVPEFALTPRWFEEDWDARHVEVRVRHDGSRYAVN